MTDAGVSIYEDDCPVFMRDGNQGYYFDEGSAASAAEKLSWVAAYVTRGQRILDVGANLGHFVKVASGRYLMEGLEPSGAAVRWAGDNLDVELRRGTIEDVDLARGSSYAAITMWDVIEHLAEPERAIATIARLLEPGGWLFLSTPDLGSVAARVLGRRWYYIDLTQHVAMFDRTNLSELLTRSGFQVVELRSFGHTYRVSYILDRLRYLHGGRRLGKYMVKGANVLRPFGRRRLYLKLGDVMGLAARRVTASSGPECIFGPSGPGT